MLNTAEQRAALEDLRPSIAAHRIRRAAMRWRAAKHGGMFPRRMWETLNRKFPPRRPLFIGQTSDGVQFVGDFRQVYPAVQMTDPAFQVPYVSWMASQLRARPGDYLDVGTNIGIVAAGVAKTCPDRHVHAFEPMPETARIAAATFALNGLPNVTLWPLAASDKDGVIGMGAPAGESDRAAIGGGGVEVRTVTLDGMMDRTELGPVALVKIDTEGHDFAVIKGATRLLARHRPLLIFEYFPKYAHNLPWSLDDAISLLRGLGYARFNRISDKGERLPMEFDGLDVVNIVCE